MDTQVIVTNNGGEPITIENFVIDTIKREITIFTAGQVLRWLKTFSAHSKT